jgi:hypothetical protein
MNDQVELIPADEDRGESPPDLAPEADDLGAIEVEKWRDWYFWAVVYPGFESTLLFAPDTLPPDTLSEYESVDCSANLTFYDCDGGVANEVSLAFPGSRATAVQLGQFMSAVKLQSGWKSALVKVSAPDCLRPFCRLQNSSKATFLGDPEAVSEARSAFFPVTVAPDRRTVLALLRPFSAENHPGSEGEDEAENPVTAKCRFFKGGRTPEAVLDIPRGGFRILAVESEFAEYCDPSLNENEDESESGASQAYLRISARGGESLYAQVLEIVGQDEKTQILSSVG